MKTVRVIIALLGVALSMGVFFLISHDLLIARGHVGFGTELIIPIASLSYAICYILEVIYEK